jgi:hypothetical protein
MRMNRAGLKNIQKAARADNSAWWSVLSQRISDRMKARAKLRQLCQTA